MSDPTLDVRELRAGAGQPAQSPGVSLWVPSGHLTAVLGGPASGKSQLLRCIGLDLAPLSGSVRVDGVEIIGATGDRRHHLRSRVVQLVHPPAAAQRERTVPGSASGFVPPGRRATIPVAGVRQRIQIARALTQRSRVLLLDEPLTGVDDDVRTRILELVARTRAEGGAAVLAATRHPEVARALGATRVVVLERGAVVESGSAEAVLGPLRAGRGRWLARRRRSA